MELDYKNYFKDQNILCFVYYLVTKLLYWTIYFILLSSNNINSTIISCSLQFCFTLLGFLLMLEYFKENFYNYLIIYYYINILLDLLLVYFKSYYNDTEITLQCIITVTYPIIFGIRYFTHILIGSILYFIGISVSLFTVYNQDKVEYYMSYKNTTYNNSTSELINDYNSKEVINNANNLFLLEFLPININQLLFITGSFFVIFIYGYYEEMNSRINFIKYVKKRSDKKKDDEIFDNLVPKFIQNKMKTGDRGTTKEKETVTIIFANIADFDDLVATLKPTELINLLDKIYGTFDQLCKIHGIQKIETVGYTYMAAGGIRECEKDMDENTLIKHHAIRTYELAIDIIDIMSGIVLQDGRKVQIKIGLHTGKVLAGVIGEHKPQFSLIGDTVNTAARMGAKVDKMCALLTEECYSIVKEEYSDFEEKLKEFKGKGKLKCYQANPIKKLKNQDNKLKIFKKFITRFLLRCIQESGGNMKIEDFFPNEGKPENNVNSNLNKQNSARSNLSDFIIEEDIVNNYNFGANNNNVLKDNNFYSNNLDNIEDFDLNSIKKKITKYKLANEKSNINFNKKKESNKFFKESFLLLNLQPNFDINNTSSNNIVDNNNNNNNNNSNSNNQNKNKAIYESSYYLYEKFKLSKFFFSYNSSIIINYCFLLTKLIHFINSLEYVYNEKYKLLILFINMILIIALYFIIIKTKLLLRKKRNLIQNLYIVIYVAFIVLCQLKYKLLSNQYYLEICIEKNFTLISLIFNNLIEYKKQFYGQFICMIIIGMNLISAITLENYIVTKYCSLSLVISFSLLVFIILREYIATFDFIKNQEVTVELNNAETLLFNLMPPNVVKCLKEDRLVADEIEDVTILYTDIVNFTKFSAAQKDQSNIVRMLIELFKRMDNACVEFDVYKVHTIGDCFVVLGCTGKVQMNERNLVQEARNVVNIGRKMIEIIRSVRETKEVNFPDLNMRIGIHTVRLIISYIF